MATNENTSWSECPLVELNPGVLSGTLVLRGTRLPVNAIVDNLDYGVSVPEIAKQFEDPPDSVREILAYVKSHRASPANP